MNPNSLFPVYSDFDATLAQWVRSALELWVATHAENPALSSKKIAVPALVWANLDHALSAWGDRPLPIDFLSAQRALKAVPHLSGVADEENRILLDRVASALARHAQAWKHDAQGRPVKSGKDSWAAKWMGEAVSQWQLQTAKALADALDAPPDLFRQCWWRLPEQRSAHWKQFLESGSPKSRIRVSLGALAVATYDAGWGSDEARKIAEWAVSQTDVVAPVTSTGARLSAVCVCPSLIGRVVARAEAALSTEDLVGDVRFCADLVQPAAFGQWLTGLRNGHAASAACLVPHLLEWDVGRLPLPGWAAVTKCANRLGMQELRVLSSGQKWSAKLAKWSVLNILSPDPSVHHSWAKSASEVRAVLELETPTDLDTAWAELDENGIPEALWWTLWEQENVRAADAVVRAQRLWERVDVKTGWLRAVAMPELTVNLMMVLDAWLVAVPNAPERVRVLDAWAKAALRLKAAEIPKLWRKMQGFWEIRSASTPPPSLAWWPHAIASNRPFVPDLQASPDIAMEDMLHAFSSWETSLSTSLSKPLEHARRKAAFQSARLICALPSPAPERKSPRM